MTDDCRFDELDALLRSLRVTPIKARDSRGRQLPETIRAAPIRRLLCQADVDFVRSIEGDLIEHKRERTRLFWIYLSRLLRDYELHNHERMDQGRVSLSRARIDDLILLWYGARLAYAALVWGVLFPAFHFQNRHCERVINSTLDAMRDLIKCPVIPIRQAGLT